MLAHLRAKDVVVGFGLLCSNNRYAIDKDNSCQNAKTQVKNRNIMGVSGIKQCAKRWRVDEIKVSRNDQRCLSRKRMTRLEQTNKQSECALSTTPLVSKRCRDLLLILHSWIRLIVSSRELKGNHDYSFLHQSTFWYLGTCVGRFVSGSFVVSLDRTIFGALRSHADSLAVLGLDARRRNGR